MELERRELETDLKMEKVSNEIKHLTREREMESVQSELWKKIHSMEEVSTMVTCQPAGVYGSSCNVGTSKERERTSVRITGRKAKNNFHERGK